MITEDYVSFETAKLLKEKGFNWDCKTKKFYPEPDYDQESPNGVSAPTLQMAMKWLREVHNIAVSVYVFNRDLPIKENEIRYTCDIATTKISSKEGHLRLTGTYEEACEAAIEYCLVNLI
jgi:hypothetical protein